MILKEVWSEDPERCYSLHRIDGKTVRVRGIFGHHLIAEIFSPVLLQWQAISFTAEPVPEHTRHHVNEATEELLSEVKLILGHEKPPMASLRFC